jgi:SAM-dependent methyltransferase
MSVGIAANHRSVICFVLLSIQTGKQFWVQGRMGIRSAIRKLIRTTGFDLCRVRENSSALRQDSSERVKAYVDGGRVPWSYGYVDYRRQLLNDVINNQPQLERIASGAPIDSGYGLKMCERCVEYPWLLSRIKLRGARILDAGSTLNHDFILDHSALSDNDLTIITLAPEHDCYWKRGISYVFGDLREMTFRDEYFDLVACISTLEHIGMDNSLFASGHDLSLIPSTYLSAVSEMHRVLKPGGRLLLTVPYGRDPKIPETMVFNAQMMAQVVDQFRARQTEMMFYRYTSDGWQSAKQRECEDAEYEPWVMLSEKKRPHAFPQTTDGAAAARAVCCVELYK